MSPVWPSAQDFWPLERLFPRTPSKAFKIKRRRFLRQVLRAEVTAWELFRRARWGQSAGAVRVQCPVCRARPRVHKSYRGLYWYYCTPQHVRIWKEQRKGRKGAQSPNHGCGARFSDVVGTPFDTRPRVRMPEVLLLLYYGRGAVPLCPAGVVMQRLVAQLAANRIIKARRLHANLRLVARAFCGEVIRQHYAAQIHARVLADIKDAERRATQHLDAERREAQIARIKQRYRARHQRLDARMHAEIAAVEHVSWGMTGHR